MKGGLKTIWRYVATGFYSPIGLMLRALILVALFMVGHLLGWRETMSVISGTVPDGTEITNGLMIKAAYYLAMYFAAVLVAPILILAAVMMLAVGFVLNRKNTRAREVAGSEL